MTTDELSALHDAFLAEVLRAPNAEAILQRYDALLTQQNRDDLNALVTLKHEIMRRDDCIASLRAQLAGRTSKDALSTRRWN